MTYTGQLLLDTQYRHNKSVIANSFFDGVLKITRPSYTEEETPMITIIHIGGGYVDGDSYYSEISVDSEARLAVTTQASTKIYKTLRRGVLQKAKYLLKEKSKLYIKQDPVIAYKDAKYTQATEVFMAADAEFYYTDILTPGWAEDGKLFQFTEVHSKLKIFTEGNLTVFDHLRIRPDEDLPKIMQLEGYTHLGSLFYINPTFTENKISLLREELSFTSKSDVQCGVSQLAVCGICVRILAKSTTDVEKIFLAIERFIYFHFDHELPLQWRK